MAGKAGPAHCQSIGERLLTHLSGLPTIRPSDRRRQRRSRKALRYFPSRRLFTQLKPAPRPRQDNNANRQDVSRAGILLASPATNGSLGLQVFGARTIVHRSVRRAPLAGVVDADHAHLSGLVDVERGQSDPIVVGEKRHALRPDPDLEAPGSWPQPEVRGEILATLGAFKV